MKIIRKILSGIFWAIYMIFFGALGVVLIIILAIPAIFRRIKLRNFRENLKLGDVVSIYYDGGYWQGIIVNIQDGKVILSDYEGNEIDPVSIKEIRPRYKK